MKTKETEINKLSEAETFCLDAYLVNGNKELAYRLSRDRKLAGTPESQYQCQQRWLRSAPVVAYTDRGKAMNMNRATTPDESGNNSTNRSRDELLTELNQLATSANDTKTRADILCRIADLQRFKDAEPAKAEQQVKYYLPLPETEFLDYIQSRLKTDPAFADTVKNLTSEG